MAGAHCQHPPGVCCRCKGPGLQGSGRERCQESVGLPHARHVGGLLHLSILALHIALKSVNQAVWLPLACLAILAVQAMLTLC